MSLLIHLPLVPIDKDVNTIIYSAVGQNALPSSQVGAFIGNGKVGVLTDFDNLDIQKSIITTDIKYSGGVYKTNIIEPFYLNKFMFFEDYASNGNISSTPTSQTLSMSYATFSSVFEIKNEITLEQINVDVFIYCPYHMPYCIIQTLELTPTRPLNIMDSAMDIKIFHEIYSKNNIIDATYNNNYIATENGGIYILSGEGIDVTSKYKVAFACAYEFQNENTKNHGFNIYKNSKNNAINKFTIPGVLLNTTTKVNIISASMTEFDFENPLEEVKRIVLSNINSFSVIRNSHINSWTDKWDTSISITPKEGITIDLDNDIKALNQLINVSLYNIYTTTRENINTEINPFNLQVIDNEGMLLYEGDLWFIPLLTIIKPEITRSILEQRYHTIAKARQISAGYGYKGAKYPYSNDVMGYRGMTYYNTHSVVSMFNNALISINVWNYYRVTKDADWLQSKGYPILKDISDFIVSVITFKNGKYSLDMVSSLATSVGQNNNAFTNNMVRLALKYSIECCYELSIKPSDKWARYYEGLGIKYINPGTFNDIIKVNDEQVDESKYFILEILFLLVPYYSDLYFKDTNLNHNGFSLKRNLDYYIDKVETQYIDHAYNTALKAIIYGMYAQIDENYSRTYDYYLHKFIEDNVINNDLSGSVNAWLNMKPFGLSTTNSLTTNSIFLLIILQGIPQIKVQGGVTPNKFYYEEMKISYMKSANMPCHWKDIKISNMGDPEKLESVVIKNRILFTSQVACTDPAPI